MADYCTVLSKDTMRVEVFTQYNPQGEKHTRALVQPAIIITHSSFLNGNGDRFFTVSDFRKYNESTDSVSQS